MKRILFFLIIFIPFVAHAQLVTDDFESYNAGSFDGQFDTTQWTGWVGGVSNAGISTDYAFSGTKSLKVFDGTGGTKTDLVALLGTLDQGVDSISFMQYTPSTGSDGAYYNLRHNYTNAVGGIDTATEFLITTNPIAAEIWTDGSPYSFTPTLDAWVEHKFVFDFTNKSAKFYYGGTLIHTWVLDTDTGGGPAPNTINAIDFYAHDAAGPNSVAYYDDITHGMPVSINRVNTFDGKFDVISNPANGLTILDIELETSQDIQVAIYDTTGKLVQSFKDKNVTNKRYSLDSSNYSEGVYLVGLETNGQLITRQIVLNR